MRILLIHPPKSPVAVAPMNMEPLALEVLAAAVPEQVVQILDLRFEGHDALRRTLLSFLPRLVGVTVNSTIYVKSAYGVLREVREVLPASQVVVGGNHPTLAPEDFTMPEVDALFLGWADVSFPAYVRALETGGDMKNVPGVRALAGGVPVGDEPGVSRVLAQDVQLPNRSLTRRYWGRYRDELGRRTYLVNTVRGCPDRCTFCACWPAAGGRVLVRTPQDVARELEALPRGGVRVFFADDHTFADVHRAEELCRRIQHEHAGRRYSGYTRADTVVKHVELFEAWRRAGLKDITIGVEAASDARLSRMQKGTSTRINEEAIRILHRLDITPFAQLLVDPDFDEKDFDELSEFVRRTNLSHPIFVILTPLPGTVLYEQQRSRITMPYEYFDFAHAIVPTRLSLERFLVRFSRLYRDAYSLRRNLRQRLQRAGVRPAPRGDRSELPRPVDLLRLAGWHVLAGPLESRLRRHHGLDVRR